MKFIIHHSSFIIPPLGAVILFFCFSFTKFQQTNYSPKYKTLNDSVFVVGDLIVVHGIYFNLNKCDFRKDSTINPSDSLKPVADFLKKHSTLKVEVGYHTDYVNPSSSQKLTYCRAESVYNELLKLGIDTARLSCKGWGEVKPYVLQNDIILPSKKVAKKGMILTDKYLNSFKSSLDDYQFLRSLNRRTELEIIKTDFK